VPVRFLSDAQREQLSGFRGAERIRTGIRRQILFLLVKGVLSDLKL
jgi:hypothetical protein